MLKRHVALPATCICLALALPSQSESATSLSATEIEPTSMKPIYESVDWMGQRIAIARAESAIETSLWRSDGSDWNEVPDAQSRGVHSIAAYGSGVVVAGSNADDRSFVRAWDGKTWTDIGTGLEGRIHDVATYRGGVVAVGEFVAENAAGSVMNVGLWEDDNWLALGSGTDEAIHVALNVEDRLVIGGRFTVLNDSPLTYLASWDGSGWNPAPFDVPGPVLSIVEAPAGNGVIVSGRVQSAPGLLSEYTILWSDIEARAANETPSVSIPTSPSLSFSRPAPNPVTSETTLRFVAPTTGHAVVRIYDATGREVDEPLSRTVGAGDHAFTLDASRLDSGVYFARLRFEGQTRSQKLVVR